LGGDPNIQPIAVLEKNEVVGLTFPTFKTYYKLHFLITVKRLKIDQWARTESPDISPYIVILSKSARTVT